MGCCEAEFPDLGGKTEAVVVKLLTASIGRASSWKEDGRIRTTDHNLGNMLIMLKRAATDPCDDRDLDVQEWHAQVLRARKALFLKLDKCAEAEEFPFRKRKRRNFQNLSSTMVDRRNRRSKRLVDLEKFGEILCTEPSTRIPIGRHAQADVPEWIGPIGRRTGLEDDLDDSRWLGTSVSPLKWNDTVVDWESIYKGRRDPCGCVFPGSIECVKLHVRKARRDLKSILGCTFFDWHFQQMGEEVSRSWTLKDQVKFDEIVRLNPDSAGKSFMVEALKHFTNKSKKEIVSYYFNVYVLRWIRRYTRLKSEAADGDDNINDEDSRKALDYLMNMKDSEADNSKHSNRRKSPCYYEEIRSRDLKRMPLFKRREEGNEILSTKLPSCSSQYGPIAFDIGTTISSLEDVEAMERMNPVDVARLSCRDSMIASSRAHFVAHSFLTSQQEYKKLEGKYQTIVQSLEDTNKKLNDMSEEWSVKEATYLSREEDLLRQITRFQIQRDKARRATLKERERVKEAGIGGMKLILELLHERGFTDDRLYLEDVCPELFPSTSDPVMGQPSPEDNVPSESDSDNDKYLAKKKS